MMPNLQPRRGALSLIEVIVVMALFGVLSLVTVTTLWSSIRIERADAAAFDRTVRHSTLADQFREDVAQSTGAPAKAGEHIASAECLILAQRDNKRIVYSLAKKNVVRTVIADANTTSHNLPIGEDVRVEFVRESGLLTVRFYDVRPRSEHKHPIEFSAALGGDVR